MNDAKSENKTERLFLESEHKQFTELKPPTRFDTKIGPLKTTLG